MTSSCECLIETRVFPNFTGYAEFQLLNSGNQDFLPLGSSVSIGDKLDISMSFRNESHCSLFLDSHD